MPKHGHQLSLIPQFPAEVSTKLTESFSISTAEEFLGFASTQDALTLADALSVTPQLLDRALQAARSVVDPKFLRELERPVERYATGARIDEFFELPPELARHLQEG